MGAIKGWKDRLTRTLNTPHNGNATVEHDRRSFEIIFRQG